MKRILVAIPLLAFAPCFAAAVTSTLDGTWHVTGSVQDNAVNPVCVLAEKEGKITGTCTGTDEKPVPVTGTVTDKTIKWQYDTAYQGGGITLFFTGMLDKEDHLKGGIYVEPYAVDGEFTATKDKAAAPVAKP